MTDTLTIGEVSRCTGVPIKTIRFYEAEQVIPPPARTEAGYRLYTSADVRRLHLARQARLLGLVLQSPFPESAGPPGSAVARTALPGRSI